MSAFGDKLAKKKPATTDVEMCLDGELSVRRDAALSRMVAAARTVEQLQKAPPTDGRSVGSPVRDAQKTYDDAALEVAALEEEMRGASIKLRIRAVPSGDYNLYQTKNKPRPGHNEAYNPQTFFLYVAPARPCTSTTRAPSTASKSTSGTSSRRT